MVSTRQAVKARKSAGETFSPAGSGDEHEEGTPEPSKTRGTKRARTTKMTAEDQRQERRRKAAKLSMLPGMPVDILYEIFSLVHPRDLLRTSWTAKVLNEFLTRKSSRHIWQASFETIPESEKPPSCPSGMTEMAYANLLYGKYCMNCAKPNPLFPTWSVLLRLCERCVGKMTIDLCSAPTGGLHCRTDMSKFLPTFRLKYTNGRVAWKVLCSDSERLNQELAAAGEGSKEDVMNKYESLVRERREFSTAMSRLDERAEKLKEDARADVQKRRIERIWEKLSEEGWGEEIATRKSLYAPGLKQIKGVMMFRPLGEKAWAELRGPLNEFMKNESERIHVRLDTKRWGSRTAKVEEIVDSFRFSLPHPHDFSPPAADICWIPEVQKAIIDGTDEEFQVCEANIRSTIPELSVTWLEERRKFFLQLLPQDSPTLEQLSLAATLFDCTKCYVHGMRIEETLSHRCHRRWDEYKPFKERFSSVNSANVFHNDVGTPWNPEFSEYRYSAKLSALIREVILECGENPDTITAKEMNRKHYRFACFGKDGAVTVLSWSQAFEHKCQHGSTPCRVLRPDELPEYVPEPGAHGAWGCLRCWGTGEPKWHRRHLAVIEVHLAHSHQIKNPTEEDYYNVDPNHTVSFKYRPGNSV